MLGKGQAKAGGKKRRGKVSKSGGGTNLFRWAVGDLSAAMGKVEATEILGTGGE